MNKIITTYVIDTNIHAKSQVTTLQFYWDRKQIWGLGGLAILVKRRVSYIKFFLPIFLADFENLNEINYVVPNRKVPLCQSDFLTYGAIGNSIYIWTYV